MSVVPTQEEEEAVILEPYIVIDLGIFSIIIPHTSSEFILIRTLQDDNLPFELKKKNIRSLIEKGVDINCRKHVSNVSLFFFFFCIFLMSFLRSEIMPCD